ncbi:DEAD H (Asp-Glu-Ala-Asp His) box helicase 11 [Chytridiales sp. JEL 0842]|nr:DEAD H (Asp-Glu-Ala-Asp His) box helicase 11 [Chytridiales sp. JEL 0842]
METPPHEYVEAAEHHVASTAKQTHDASGEDDHHRHPPAIDTTHATKETALPPLPSKVITTTPLKQDIAPPDSTTKNTTNTSPSSACMSPSTSNEQLNSPLSEPLDAVEEADVGTDTTAVHILFQSKVGWMCWKDTESSLFALFEKAFAACKCSIKFSDALDQFGVEMEVPNSNVAKLEKDMKGRNILQEIDKLHGLSPVTRTYDVKVLHLTKTMGSTVSASTPRSSLEALQARIRGLEQCTQNRMKEVTAIKEQWEFLKGQIESKMDALEKRALSKPKKIEEFERVVVESVMAELAELQACCLVFRAQFSDVQSTMLTVAKDDEDQSGPIQNKEAVKDLASAQQYFRFPFQPYNVQKDFMVSLVACIEAGHVGVFESPTGTWLTDHNARTKEDRLKEIISNMPTPPDDTPADPDEPAWVREHAKRALEREALYILEKEEEKVKRQQHRLEQLRKEYTQLDGSRRFSKKPKKLSKTDQNGSNAGDDDFLVDDYSSDSESTVDDAFRSIMGEEKVDEDNDTEIDQTKIYYCSRTHSQLSQFVRELQKTEYGADTFSVSLGSRKNLCINEDVQKLKSVARMNDKCLDLQKGTGCAFLPKEKRVMSHFNDHVNASVRDIEDLARLGKELEVCPYYGARTSIPSSQLVTLPYNLMLQKAARESLGIKLKNNIVVFDEAHNIMDTITSIHSVSLELFQVERAACQLMQYFQKFKNRLKGKNISYIKQLLVLLDALQKSLKEANLKKKNGDTETNKFHNPSDFVHTLQIDHINLFKLQRYLEESRIAQKIQGFVEKEAKKDVATGKDGFIPKHLPSLQVVHSLINSLLNASVNGRVGIVVSEQEANTCFKYLLLNPADVFQEIVNEAKSVILAGGTMEPMNEFRYQLLGHIPDDKIDYFSCGHIIPSSSLLTVAVPVGPKSLQFDFTLKTRSREDMIVELGQAVVALSVLIPGGMVCFFASYSYMEYATGVWKKAGIVARIEKKKKLFVEPRQSNEVEKCLSNYNNVLAMARENKGTQTGALLLSVVGGKMSEGINFSDDLARGVIMVGLPFPNKGSPELIEKMNFMDQCKKASQGLNLISSAEYYENLCMRSLNQSIGRAIRHKSDYAAIYLIDHRFRNPKIRSKLPGWIRDAGIQDVENFGNVLAATAKFFKEKKQE